MAPLREIHLIIPRKDLLMPRARYHKHLHNKYSCRQQIDGDYLGCSHSSRAQTQTRVYWQ